MGDTDAYAYSGIAMQMVDELSDVGAWDLSVVPLRSVGEAHLGCGGLSQPAVLEIFRGCVLRRPRCGPTGRPCGAIGKKVRHDRRLPVFTASRQPRWRLRMLVLKGW